ncbi:hypothetical protein TYRP_011806 [Tyrophagus putrescentiae]|nr:hypothetical protein TYRP_011806 [Tyrophagus putrescentiae]
MALRDHLLTIGIVAAVAVAALLAGGFLVGYNELLPLDRPLAGEEEPQEKSFSIFGSLGIGGILGSADPKAAVHEALLHDLDAYCLRLLETLAAHPPKPQGPGHQDQHQQLPPFYELLLGQLWACKPTLLEGPSSKADPELERSIRRIDADYELVLTLEPARDQQALRLSLMADWVRRRRRQKMATAN